MAFHRNNNGPNNRYNNNRPNNFRPRHNNNQQQGGQNRRHVNRVNHVFESNGPDGRVRGTAQQLVEKYVGMARDAHAGGDPVLMLNYYQHAEHYQRLYAEIMEENGTAEREREAQRAQYNQQPSVDGDANFAPDTMPQQSKNESGSFGQQQQQRDDYAPRQQPEQQHPQQRPPRESRYDDAYQGDQQNGERQNDQRSQQRDQRPQNQNPIHSDQQFDQELNDSGSMSTGGRVLGRRPAPQTRDNQPNRQQANQLQDDHMPSFLKQDVPTKQARPAPATKAPAETTPAPAAVPTRGRPPAAKAAAPVVSGNDAAEPAAAAFGKRRAPATRRTAADKADDAAMTETE